MVRSERRRWERDIWPHWVNYITFKKIKRIGPNMYDRSDRRTPAEITAYIDAMLVDMGELP